MRDKRKTLDKKSVKLEVKNTLIKQKLQEHGITLIALVVTIIILLILSGVTLNMALSENGLFKKAKEAVDKYDRVSEQEAIELIVSDIKTDLIIGGETSNEKYIGDKLSEMSSVTGDWKNVTVGENTYKDGWYLVEKGKEITGYGEARYNWLINYDTGEIIELKDGEYTIANANASGAIVDETLKVNIDPVNLQDPAKWGEGVSFHGGDPKQATTKSELKFDGIDDYLKIENVNIEKSAGVTFEFYGYCYGEGFGLLNKINFTDNGEIDKENLSSFRSVIKRGGSDFCLGGGIAESELSKDHNHWINVENVKLETNVAYVSITMDCMSGSLSFFQDGVLKAQTKCSVDYLKKGDLFKNELPFVVGMGVGGNKGSVVVTYYNFSLYACRLYTRVLSDKEIEKNYAATTSYHNDLVK